MNIKEPESYVQCQCCGHIYQVDYRIQIEMLMIKSTCNQCGYDKALNLGTKEEEIYEFLNINVDPRYY